jgi:hypothetical protein
MIFYTDPRIMKFINGDGDLKQDIVIGETFDMYITTFRETSIPYWDQYGRYEASMCIPIGFHKSRLFVSQQLELF